MSSNNLLTIDIGNTNISCALCNNGETSYFSIDDLKALKEKLGIDTKNTKTIVSSVSKETPYELDEFSPIFIKDYFKDNFFFNMPVNYNETVGIDRLICSLYAFHEKLNAVIVDSGSFTTIDFIDSNGFNGGYILPGLKLLQDNYQKGSLLKGFDPQILSMNSIPQKSEDAVNLGLTFSFIDPIKNILKMNERPTVIFTGGNAEVLNEHLGGKLDKKLIHKSMQLILREYL